MTGHEIKEYITCDRCGNMTSVHITLNAIPRNKNVPVPFELKMAEWWIMRPCVLCANCVQSFFDWWKEGDDA